VVLVYLWLNLKIFGAGLDQIIIAYGEGLSICGTGLFSFVSP